MSVEEAGTEDRDQDTADKVLQIKKVIGGYGKSLGISKADVIIAIGGDIFLGTAEDFKDYFDIDEDDDRVANPKIILTIKRDEAIFNIICHQRVTFKFDQIENPYPEPSIKVQQTLEMAKHSELSEYLIYYDNKKKC
jgi:hypothetical protein